MLEHWGFNVHTNGTVTHNSSKQYNFNKYVVNKNHNQARITRVIECLRLFKKSSSYLAQVFNTFTSLLPFDRVSETTKNFWLTKMTDELNSDHSNDLQKIVVDLQLQNKLGTIILACKDNNKLLKRFLDHDAYRQLTITPGNDEPLRFLLQQSDHTLELTNNQDWHLTLPTFKTPNPNMSFLNACLSDATLNKKLTSNFTTAINALNQNKRVK